MHLPVEGVFQTDMNGKTISARQIPFGPKDNGGSCHGLAWENADGGRLGNYALMDQTAALQWVARNIAAFALGCLLSSGYGFVSGAWPFGAVEAIWTVIALRRFSQARLVG